MKAKILAILIIPVFLMKPVSALAHGGGLDSYGCHTESATGGYHCHGNGSQDDYVISTPGMIFAGVGATSAILAMFFMVDIPKECAGGVKGDVCWPAVAFWSLLIISGASAVASMVFISDANSGEGAALTASSPLFRF